MKDVFQGTAATVSVRLTKGKSASAKTAKLVFTCTEGAKIDPATLQLPAKPFVGQASPVKHRVVFPDVPAAKDSYEVSYHVEYDGKQIPGQDKWKVWPDVVDLTTKRKVDGKLKQTGNFVVKLVQGESRRDYVIPFDGQAMLLVPEPGAFDLQVPSPERFVGWLEGKDKGRARVMEWDIVPHKASIESPVAGDDPIRAYVNFGTRNELKVEVVTSLRTGGPAPNQDVYVEVTFENATKRGKSPSGATDADYAKERTVETLTNLAKSNNNLTWKGKLKSGADGKATFTVYLGKGGGEKCTLKVGSTASVEDDKRELESWRKLFVQHSHSDTERTKKAWPMAQRNATVDAFKKLFVEIDFTIDGKQDDKIYPQDIGLKKRCGWVDGSDIDETAGQKYFVINCRDTEDRGDVAEGWELIANKLAPVDPKIAGLYINVAACDLMFDLKNMCMFGQMVKDGVKISRKGVDVTRNKKAFLGGVPNKAHYQPRGSYKVRLAKNMKDVFVEGTLPSENFKVSSAPKADRGSVEAWLPDAVASSIPAGEKFTVYFDIDVVMRVEGSINAVGMSDGGSNIILGEGAKGDAETNNTVIHEIGHAIGMCGTVVLLNGKGNFVNRLPDYTVHRKNKKDGSPVEEDSYVEHTRWYSHRGHLGDHCATGLGRGAYDGWGNLDVGTLRNLASYSCVIYGQGQNFRTPLSFCPECSDMIKAMELWVGKMPKT